MAVLQMQKISICGMKTDRKAILEELQSHGAMEVDTSFVEDEELKHMDTLEARQIFDRNAKHAEKALEILKTFHPQEESAFSGLAGKELFEREIYEENLAKKDETLSKINSVVRIEKDIQDAELEIFRKQDQREMLAPWKDLDAPLSTRETRRTRIFIGTIEGEHPEGEILKMIAEKYPELKAEVKTFSMDNDLTYLAVIILKEEENAASEALRSLGFAEPAVKCNDIPAREMKAIDDEIASLEKTIASLREEMKQYYDCEKEFKVYSDYYRVRAQKYEVLATIPQSERTFFITGFVPQIKADSLKKVLTDRYNCLVELEDVKEEEQAPIALHNGALGGTMEGIVTSFGLPGKGEFDPSGVMALTFFFLFGLMLSDAAYGAIIAIACFAIIKKNPRMEEGKKKTFRMFMCCGLSTVFWGIMFGGYFGDLIPTIQEVFMHQERGSQALWFEPLSNPMQLLIWCMLFGLIHLFMGLALKGYMCLKNGKIVDFICDVVFWFMLLVGLVFQLLSTEMFAGIAGRTFEFSAGFMTVMKGLAIVGAIGIVLMTDRETKNPFLRIGKGLDGLYGITGWLSDVLSYSRLLALGLATGVIGSVINQMGTMKMKENGVSIGGVIGFVIIFVLGHVFNLAINLLGAYVHTCRLEYVEFFGKFYQGGGREFNPFKENTKYIDVKEDIKL